MAYIHELEGWPNFTWQAQALAQALTNLRHKQGRLLGRMEGLGFDLRSAASVSALTSDVVSSSAIEGEKLNPAEVRSSISTRLGLENAGVAPARRHVEGVVDMLLDATRNYQQPLSAERLFGWHALLFPTGRSGMFSIKVGQWRDDARGPMQVVSGRLDKPRVHFQAPAAARLDAEMAAFLDWFNAADGSSSLDPVLKAAIAHLWFVTIHPFDDGNGRIARAIADLALARADQSQERYYSMSASIEATRSHYYFQLESSQRGSLDITSWLVWFLDCLDRAIDDAGTLLAAVLFKGRLWQRLEGRGVNDRQRNVINRMLEPDWQGYINSSKYAKLAKCSTDTALRDIKALLEWGVLVQNEGGGRSTSYRLVAEA